MRQRPGSWALVSSSCRPFCVTLRFQLEQPLRRRSVLSASAEGVKSFTFGSLPCPDRQPILPFVVDFKPVSRAEAESSGCETRLFQPALPRARCPRAGRVNRLHRHRPCLRPTPAAGYPWPKFFDRGRTNPTPAGSPRLPRHPLLGSPRVDQQRYSRTTPLRSGEEAWPFFALPPEFSVLAFRRSPPTRVTSRPT